MKRLAIIPAKSNSRRLKSKNFKLINNIPMYKYTLNNLLKSKLFNKVHISSDVMIEKKYQEFLRPGFLCKNNTSLNKVIHWVLKELKKRGETYDTVCLAYATSPMISEIDFKRACKKFEKSNKIFPLISISKYHPSIDEAMVTDGKFIKPLNRKKMFADSKNHKDHFFDTGSFIFFPTSFFYTKNFSNNKFSNKFIPFELSREKSIDINTKDDFEFVKILMKKK